MHNRYSFILSLPILLAVTFLYFSIPNSEIDVNNSGRTINAVIGDQSYVEFYGEKPGENVSDRVRIRTHLKYIEQLLRERPISHLSPDRKKNRLHYLDLLREYYRAGEFPQNDGHPDLRRPTFIDEEGNICAVGYMVARSAGRKVAERINEKYKYAYIPEIDDPVFRQWVEESGFTITELAMIQPTYSIKDEEVEINRNHVDLSYGLTTGLLASANTIYLTNRAQNPWLFSSPKKVHWLGMASGTGSIILGVFNLDNQKTYYRFNNAPCFNCTYDEITENNHLRTGISIGNIGIGMINVIRSAYHLISSKKPEASKMEMGATYLSTGSAQVGEPVPVLKFRVRF